MNVNVAAVVSVVAYLLLAPLFGGLLAGADRRITARMQGRVGPPLLQPFYDVLKLREKEDIIVNRVQTPTSPAVWCSSSSPVRCSFRWRPAHRRSSR